VARRDRRIASLQRRVDRLDRTNQRLLDQPSFRIRIHEERRLRAWEKEIGAPSRSVIAHGKFYVYDFARSHGIDVPEQYGMWDDVDDIPWDELPDKVVVKAARASTSRGVLPVRRVDGGWRRATRDTIETDEQLRAHLAALVARETIRGPFSAEEFLDADGAGTPPVDVKCFAFYGDVQAVLLRRSPDFGNTAATQHRVVDLHGQDLVDEFGGRATHPDIPVTNALDDIVDCSRRFSLALRVPFSRIDMYEVGGRIVFGEVTPRPGNVWFGPKVDVMLGEAWERAQVRLWRDIADGMAPEPEWGPHGASRGDR
jgi:hypothetical protein